MYKVSSLLILFFFLSYSKRHIGKITNKPTCISASVLPPIGSEDVGNSVLAGLPCALRKSCIHVPCVNHVPCINHLISLYPCALRKSLNISGKLSFLTCNRMGRMPALPTAQIMWKVLWNAEVENKCIYKCKNCSQEVSPREALPATLEGLYSCKSPPNFSPESMGICREMGLSWDQKAINVSPSKFTGTTGIALNVSAVLAQSWPKGFISEKSVLKVPPDAPI